MSEQVKRFSVDRMTGKAIEAPGGRFVLFVDYEHLVDELREELAITDKLLADRQRLLAAIPECEVHGPCVPHALEWIELAKRRMAAPEEPKG